ncbi:hypothetical protein MMC07_003659 [Pseudocyphellaria aurata]|nr:hypothetical protein [Pseudocyphellaria aurata]
MAIWPFGRKSKKKLHSDSPSMGASRNKPPDGARRDPGSDVNDISPPALGRRLSLNESQRRKRSSSRKLTKAQRSRAIETEKGEPLRSAATPSLPPLHPHDHEKLGLDEGAFTDAAPRQQPSMPPRDRGDVPSYYFHNPTSLSSLQPENFPAMFGPPTLRAARSANEPNVPRRKSSKRKAEDHAREQEVKAMSSPIPVPKRPTSHPSGFLARDSRRTPIGLITNRERPLSEVSLPLPESVHSTASMISDSHGFKISAFDVLSPRPTIRYSENPRNYGASGSIGPSRTSTRREKQPVIPEEGYKSKKRIEDLADDLDAGNIRELMERDRRRSERSRRSDQEKLQRRLQRKADKDRAAEKRREGGGGPSNENVDPKDMIEDDFGLGIASAVSSPGMKEPTFEPGETPGTQASEIWLNHRSREGPPLESPFGDIVASQLEWSTPAEDLDVPVLETAKAVRLSQASMSPPTSPIPKTHGPSSLSQLSDYGSPSTPDIPDRIHPDRRDSDNSARISSNWTAIFRRSGTRVKRDSIDRGRTAPSEFSNTSRESFRSMPPSAFARVPPARAGTPVRTQSRFREDLPELPTPPDSRLQSPEATIHTQLPPQPGQPGFTAPSSARIASSPHHPLSDIHPAFREEVALSRNQSVKSQTADFPPGAILSQSLASVDSEGSWLTGRPVKRSSQTLVNPLRESGGSIQQRRREQGASEEGSPNEKEYGGRRTPNPRELSRREGERKRQDKAGNGAIGSDSEDDNTLHSQPAGLNQEDEGTWHSAVGKQPTIVRQGVRAKSREGLLNDFQAAEDSAESSPTGDSPGGQPFGDSSLGRENSFIHRATSIDLAKGHVRHISAGSARLLNLPPRSSGEMKRISTASGERSPLSPPLPEGPHETRASDVD